MRITTAIGTFLLVGGGLWLRAQAPDASGPGTSGPGTSGPGTSGPGTSGPGTSGKDAPVRAVGLPARATPAEYQFRAPAGMLTLCAEFMGHGVPTEEGGPYSTENYVVVEAALFGAPGAKIQLSYKDFSLRINGKKQAEPSQPYVTVFANLKDPEWEPSKSESALAQTSISGAGGSQSDRTKSVPKMPIALRHTMEQRVQKASLSEGERPLPQAGLLFFEWHGEVKAIRSMELMYNGPTGKGTLALQK